MLPLVGTNADPAGAVANAAIDARNTAAVAAYTMASSTTGNYAIAQPPVGAYDLTITVMGFKKFVRTGLTVTEAAPLLKTDSKEISYDWRRSRWTICRF